MIRIYFDVVLTIVADTLYRLLPDDLKRFEDCTPKKIFPILLTADVTVRLLTRR